MPKPPNIYPYVPASGVTEYAVCIHDTRAHNYYRPLDHNESWRSDCSGEYSRCMSYFGGFTKTQAYGRARTLFGYAKIWRPQ